MSSAARGVGAPPTGRGSRGWLALMPTICLLAPAWLGLTALVQAQEQEPELELEQELEQELEATSAAPGGRLHGSLSTRYRGRATGQADDHDLDLTILLDAGDAEQEPLTFHLMGRLRQDLDGTPGDRSDPFFGLEDSRGERFSAFLNYAYADFHAFPELERLRAGRQLLYETPEVAHFDGLSLATSESSAWRLMAGAYAGLPVHRYEPPERGEELHGLFAQVRPWRGGRLRLDYMHLVDPELLGSRDNDLLGLEFGQEFGRTLRVIGRYTRLEDRHRDASLAATLALDEAALVVHASIYRLIEPQRELASTLDPFFDTLFELSPYYQTRFDLSQDFGPDWTLETGLDLRTLVDPDEVAQLNQDFDRVWVSATARDLLPHGIELQLTGESWHSATNDIRTLGFELRRRVQRLELAAGSYYSLFKYDLFQAEEREDVRTHFLSLEQQRGEHLRLQLKYEYERDAIDEFHYLTLGMRWSY